ncbi:DUF72 domain-containing protein [Vibrio gazogenes]|uniref:Uncharacterized conserved protein YecE, DUF72 family n=1 Tax=Vibrio gazogenes DSM 21264 = NBRC 103151 TaxID=1123492 RepID=A0A1M5AN34_VIBGA|nr:DUF72 domain-containing protein [Vibrio gazogenes]USP12647.1 DUF72 domain-containing protein [Vibrio gazogenes]SHF31576.1 Uncharacterized conserved protein YecE, DUF72 family [Vibrio gazogenes DSM 21264] [Vibrio gazogenes DSM 21264 = NBRC 103151]SJN57773.1 hypothetical protein BQ6471_02716 [Vibrio gazogenes]
MTNTLPIRLGLTLWSHPQWQQTLYGRGTAVSERLEKYAQVFHTVEGNTTFYASPSPTTVANWKAATGPDFRFTFKLPKQITHELMLSGCEDLLNHFMQLMAPLHERVGLWTIQLPAAFSPAHFPALQRFCRYFPADYPLGVEVRHPAFFHKGPEEKQFNQWLVETQTDRIIMDSRPVFSATPDNDVIIDAQKKKPRVPVHAIATANRPMIRFIGHPEIAENDAFFSAWIQKLPTWVAQGKQPYLMIHTPDNQLAPELSLRLYQQLQQHIALPELPSFPGADTDNQISMF